MGWLTDLLKDYPAVAVVKERLEFEEKRHEQTKARNAELQLQVDELTQENANLKRELAGLKDQIAKLQTPDDFYEQGGLLWKKGGGGPYCPKCRGTMGNFGPRHRCPRCNLVA